MSKKYLVKAKYSASGIGGVMKMGGTSRRQAIDKMLNDLGGKLESFYYTLNPDEAYLICELPDEITGAAVSMTVDSTGMADISITSLLTPEDIDKASHIAVNYRTPGS